MTQVNRINDSNQSLDSSSLEALEGLEVTVDSNRGTDRYTFVRPVGDLGFIASNQAQGSRQERRDQETFIPWSNVYSMSYSPRASRR